MPAPDARAPGAGAFGCPSCWEPLAQGRDVELAVGEASPRPVVFHAGCAPRGWEVIAGPVSLAYAMRVRGRMQRSGTR